MTSEHTSQLVSFAEVIGFARRRLILIIVGVTFGATLAFVGSGYIPKKYKSKAAITIQSGYFNHPLISAFFAGINDTAEMSSQRAALIRSALSDSFLESFERKYFQEHSSSSATPKPFDREHILRRIEYFPSNQTTFQLSVIAPTAESAAAATNEVVTHIATTLWEERHNQLTRVQRALIQQTSLLQQGLNRGPPSQHNDGLESRISLARSKLASLREYLAESHPDVISLKRQLDSWASGASNTAQIPDASPSEIDDVFFSPQSRDTTKEIIDGLLGKLAHLNIVLHADSESACCAFIDIVEKPRIPLSPFSPNRTTLTLIGAAAGLFASLTLAIITELRRNAVITPSEAETFLNVPLLGELLPVNPTPRNLSWTTYDPGLKIFISAVMMELTCV